MIESIYATGLCIACVTEKSKGGSVRGKCQKNCLLKHCRMRLSYSASYQSAFSTEYTLVYSGRAAGSHAFHKGGGSDILCLPDDPEYSDYAPGVQGTSSIYGAEYWPTTAQPLNSARQHNMPCAVCCGNW